jgi:hypothetical protein
MTISKRVQQVYISFLISAILAVINRLLTYFSGEQEWISLVLLGLFILISIVVLIYSIMEFVITKEPTDLWKVGFWGLLGLIGIIPGLSVFYGFFGLFVFFGTREYF